MWCIMYTRQSRSSNEHNYIADTHVRLSIYIHTHTRICYIARRDPRAYIFMYVARVYVQYVRRAPPVDSVVRDRRSLIDDFEYCS